MAAELRSLAYSLWSGSFLSFAYFVAGGWIRCMFGVERHARLRVVCGPIRFRRQRVNLGMENNP